MKTIRERLIAALEARGSKFLAEYPTRKYTAMTANMEGYSYFVGKAGALRIGRTITSSVPVLDKQRKKLLEG